MNKSVLSDITTYESYDDEEVMVRGKGYCRLFHQSTYYVYDENQFTLPEIETYIESLNSISEDTIDEICRSAQNWKDEQMRDYPDVPYPSGLKDAAGEELLQFITLNQITIYRNPYQKEDTTFGANFYCCPAWDTENHMEIVLLGQSLLHVEPFNASDAYFIWEEE